MRVLLLAREKPLSGRDAPQLLRGGVVGAEQYSSQPIRKTNISVRSNIQVKEERSCPLKFLSTKNS